MEGQDLPRKKNFVLPWGKWTPLEGGAHLGGGREPQSRGCEKGGPLLKLQIEEKPGGRHLGKKSEGGKTWAPKDKLHPDS